MLRMLIRATVTLLVAAAVIAVPATAGAAKRTVPTGFFGAVWGGDAEGASPAVQQGEWDRMAASGVESATIAFRWSVLQPQPGTPNFDQTDRFVTLAATHNVRLVPIVVGTPVWARRDPTKDGSPPRNVNDYAKFVRALVKRYGPSGSFWAAHPELPRRPVRDWVIWNEPHLIDYWTAPNWERGYAALLRAANRAIKKADPGATVALAGMTGASWDALEHLYSRSNARKYFDVVTIHPYTRYPSGLPRIARRVHDVMAKHRDSSKKLWITEFGWSASKGKVPPPSSTISGIQVSDAGLAARVKEGYRKLAGARRKIGLTRAYWYTWSTSYGRSPGNDFISIFAFTGLEQLSGETSTPRPALDAYRSAARRYEGCAKTTAGACKG